MKSRFGELVGRIPAVPLRRAIARISDGPFGSAFSSSDYVSDGPAVIRLGNIGFAAFRDVEVARVPQDVFERFPNSHVEPGDLLIASLGDAKNHAGRACIAPGVLGLAMVKGKCFVAKANTRVSTNQYLAVLLSSALGAEALVQQGTGATRNMLNFERLLSTSLPLPTLDQQRRIVDEFEELSRGAERVLSSLEHSIALMNEYRTSLITAAVTGELDVTTAGSGIPA